MQTNSNFQPFEHIALTFSGGGFRAAAFGTGVISYLNHLQIEEATTSMSLLCKVKYMTSASGGSFACLLYTWFNVTNRPFSEFYLKMLEILDGNKLLDRALKTLADDKQWVVGSKKQNLINSFAKVYDEIVFNGGMIKDVVSMPDWNVDCKSHLREVNIAATEFYNGLLFGQRIRIYPKDQFSSGFYFFGNGYLHLDKKTNEAAARNIFLKIKLGDMLTASSCFPGGFEPIIFPRDFAHGKLSENELASIITSTPLKNAVDDQGIGLSEKKENIQFGMMDGGITDNQGLSSIISVFKAIKSSENDYPVDLLIMNDVGSPFLKPYKPVQRNLSFPLGSLSVQALSYLGMVILGLITTIAIVFLLVKPLFSYGIFIAGTLAGILICIGLIKTAAKSLIRKLNNNQSSEGLFRVNDIMDPETLRLFIRKIYKTRISALLKMVSERVSSVSLLAGNLFLKRIRGILYDAVYDNPEFNNKTVSNFIYDLASVNSAKRQRSLARTSIEGTKQNFLVPTEMLSACAQKAFTMGTTLWFGMTETERKRDIIATGQFTTCYNLLLYIYKLEANKDCVLDANAKERIRMIKSQLETEYLKFKEQPYWFFDELLKPSAKV